MSRFRFVDDHRHLDGVKRLCDITEFNTGEGRLYLAAVLDLYARRVVGWAIDSTRTAELVVDASVMAIGRRDPDQVVHDADRGSQYTSMRSSTPPTTPASTAMRLPERLPA